MGVFEKTGTALHNAIPRFRRLPYNIQEFLNLDLEQENRASILSKASKLLHMYFGVTLVIVGTTEER